MSTENSTGPSVASLGRGFVEHVEFESGNPSHVCSRISYVSRQPRFDHRGWVVLRLWEHAVPAIIYFPSGLLFLACGGGMLAVGMHLTWTMPPPTNLSRSSVAVVSWGGVFIIVFACVFGLVLIGVAIYTLRVITAKIDVRTARLIVSEFRPGRSVQREHPASAVRLTLRPHYEFRAKAGFIETNMLALDIDGETPIPIGWSRRPDQLVDLARQWIDATGLSCMYSKYVFEPEAEIRVDDYDPTCTSTDRV